MTGPSTTASNELVNQVWNSPDDEESCKELEQRIQDPKLEEELSSAFSDFFKEESAANEPAIDKKKPEWHNCIGEQVCYPREILKPTSLPDLISAINKAQSGKTSCRAAGSRHSFSDVCPVDDGILLDFLRRDKETSGMNKVLNIDTSTLKDPGNAPNLFNVESGITIKELNIALDTANPRVALKNMGAYDGQTLAGAISTGTHGTGITLGPIASSVKSLVLVSESGTVYQIEPADGITDPAKFQPGPNSIKLIQDDDWFQSSVIAMGCLGLIYSYTLEVVPAYFLSEVRELTIWEKVKLQLKDGINSSLITGYRHFEVDLNPYVASTGLNPGQHCAVTTLRNVDEGPARGTRGAAYWLAGLIASIGAFEKILIQWLQHSPKSTPSIINKALSTLVTKKPPYVAKSFEVMNLGNVDNVQAYALELSVDASKNPVEQVDKLIQVFQKAADEQNLYLTGPVALRFVAPADAFLAPQQGRPTCMMELDMLDGPKKWQDLLKLVKSEMCVPGSGVRVHWGLDLDTVTGQEVPGMFALWPRWLSVYRQLNTSGMWNNRFTDRLGISVPRQS